MKQLIAIGIIFAIILSGCAQTNPEPVPGFNAELNELFMLSKNETATLKKNGTEIGKITLIQLEKTSEACLESLPEKCSGSISISTIGFDSPESQFSLNSNEKTQIGNYLIEFKHYTWRDYKKLGAPVGSFIVTQTNADANPSQIPLPSAGDSQDEQPPTLPF